MLSPDLFSFLSELKENNHKPWFDVNNARYQGLKKNFIAYLEELIEQIVVFDNDIQGTNPSKTLFRINRDVRFSKDKSPYKTNFGADISKGGKGSWFPGYYVHIEPQKSILAGGAYMPESEQIKKIRNYIDYTGEELLKITQAEDFVKYFGELRGERLKTVPKGFDKEHPQLHFLAMKGWYVFHNVEDTQVLAEDFATYSAKVFAALQPLNQFLITAISME